MADYEIEVNSTKIKCENIFEEIWEELGNYHKIKNNEVNRHLSQSLKRMGTINMVLEESLRKFGRVREFVREREYKDIFNELNKLHEEVIYSLEFPQKYRNLEARKKREIMEENYEEAGRIQKSIDEFMERDVGELF